jgi:Fe-Mn family superoxide dismutase
MSHVLPSLPYAPNDLEPYISANTISFHYGKHHQTYVTNLNNLIQGSDFDGLSLIDIIKRSAGQEKFVGIFNNAAQVWNHTFYWYCMKPQGGGLPSGDLKNLIEQSFGSYDEFRAQFKQAALTQFGSGWAWLVEKDGHLSIMKTPNADLPMVHGFKALLTCDVWEHAYYLDYQNRRADYVDTFFDKLVNWDFVANVLKSGSDFSKEA